MKNILIVEDDGLIAGDIESTLKRLGHGVSGVASSGEEAIASAAVRLPDLAILDIKLKGRMDGIETAHRLRERFKTPIVYLTAHADETTLKRTRYTEPYGYIIKPFREDALRATIETAAYKIVIDGAVRANEAHFRKISEFNPMMVWIIKKGGACTYVNPAWLKYTGCTMEEERDKGWMRNVHREDLWWSIQTYRTAFETQQPFRMECRLRRHDGVYRWMEGNCAPLYSVENVFDGYIGACSDIHERKTSKERLEALLADKTREGSGV